MRVVKIGGSLLELDDLDARLTNWLSQQSATHNVLIVGGGPLVEQIRQWHRRWAIDEETAHWLCIDMMSATAELLSDRMPGLLLNADYESLAERLSSTGNTLFDAGAWLREREPKESGTRLPASWDVTSDSIAARLAVALRADEFVLLKSVLAGEIASKGIEALSAAGVVDCMLPRLFPELPLTRIVNLRLDRPQQMLIQASVTRPETL